MKYIPRQYKLFDRDRHKITKEKQSMIKEESRFKDSNIFEGMVSVRAVFESIDNGKSDRKIEKILFAEENIKKNGKLLGFLKARSYQYGYELEAVPLASIDALSTGSSHGGVLMFTTERTYSALPETPPEKGFFAVLDGIEDPYNFGYAVRSLYAAGVTGILLPERNWTSAAGVVCRASAGASELIDTYSGELSEMITHLKNCGYRFAVAEAEAPETVYDADLTYPLVLAVGGEKRGFSKSISELADVTVSLPYGREFPMALSAASAATVLAFEAARQNRN